MDRRSCKDLLNDELPFPSAFEDGSDERRDLVAGEVKAERAEARRPPVPDVAERHGEEAVKFGHAHPVADVVVDERFDVRHLRRRWQWKRLD